MKSSNPLSTIFLNEYAIINYGEKRRGSI